MNMDDISLQIIKHLREGRKSFGEIGKNLSITTNTVRARVKKLMKKGVLEIVGSIDPEKIDNHFLVVVGVRLKTMRLVDKGEEFSKLKGVISVAVVTGRFDLILTVLRCLVHEVHYCHLDHLNAYPDDNHADHHGCQGVHKGEAYL